MQCVQPAEGKWSVGFPVGGGVDYSKEILKPHVQGELTWQRKLRAGFGRSGHAQLDKCY